MRVPTDMPRRRRVSKGRLVIIVVVAVLVALFLSLRSLAEFWTDYLWFGSLGLDSVFTGILRARIALGVIFGLIFFALLYVNLVIAEKLAPKNRIFGPDEEVLGRYHETVGRKSRWTKILLALFAAILSGFGMAGEWNQWLLFRNGSDFGVNDQTFNTDVGFYIFKLPFYTTVVNWLFATGVIILVITIVAHYLNGSVRLQGVGERTTPQMKAHISVILGVLALVKAADYWLQRYALTYSTRGTVDGALYTEVNAQLPAIYLLLFIALLSFLLFIVNIWRRGWALPIVAVGLWALVSLVAGTAYPAVIQRFVVEPEESAKEAKYIGENIEATRSALGLDQVKTEPFLYSQDKAAGVQNVNANPGTIRNIPLLDHNVVTPTYQRLQSQYAAYRFVDLDVDRYSIMTPSGEMAKTQVVVGARDLYVDGIPQKSWEGTKLAYNHGYGVALAPANATTTQGRPDFLIRNVPVIVDSAKIKTTIDQPQTYYGERVGGYALTNATREEVDYVDVDGQTKFTSYAGSGGVELSSFLRKAAYALKFNDLNLIVSNFIQPDTRIVYERDVRNRVEAVAPFLKFDADPYPVISNNRIVYIFDGYTTTDRYPNAQRASVAGIRAGSGLEGHRFNYIRNSVKAVVDSYDGTVKLYVVNDSDPIVNAYQKAFPSLFAPSSEMPAELREHWRYPEDLFTVQTNMYGRYHISDAKAFYEQTSAWSVAQDPGGVSGTQQVATGQTIVGQGGIQVVRTQERRMDPVYMITRLPGDQTESFVILRPFVPFSEDDSKKTLTSFMVANSDPDKYGQITLYEMPSGFNIDGPSIVQANILATTEISQQISLWNQQGSEVTFGAMILVPVNNSILYVRPLYVSSEGQTRVPELKQIVVSFGGEVVMRPSLREALQALFPGANPQTFESGSISQVITGGNTTPGTGSTSTTTTTIPNNTGQSRDELIRRAEQALNEADAALRNGDLAGYQAKVREAQGLLAQANAATTTTTRPLTPA